MSALIDGLISFLGGLYSTLAGFGIVRLSKEAAKKAAWREKWGTFMKVAGPLVMAFGVWNIVRGL